LGTPAKNILNSEKDKPSDVDFSLFWQSWNELTKNYVGDINPQELVYGAINGMLSATKDPYTMFLKPEDNKKFKDDISGEFSGIGVEIMMVNGLPTVISPLSGSPAEKAGIKGKDVISEINSEKTDGMGFETIIDKIRGENGSKVKLKITRPDTSEQLDIEVTRETIKVDSVETKTVAYSNKRVFYIKVRQFGDDTNELFAKAVADYKKSNTDMIVIDLRNNPGGYLDSAVNLASYFLDGGVVVSEVDKAGQKKDFKTSRSSVLKDAKLAVLVNEGSASASEIFAGAIKDRNRAKIFGTKTFGKGSVQVLEQLQKGSAIKITIAKWATPNGNQIDGKGIDPDVEVKAAESETGISEDPVFQKAVLETK
jgi:carboxyl-terminal processing protease